MNRYEGRLELTWTNKPLRLLAHEDGSYEWVPPSDYRVAEVRLLHDVDLVGEVANTRAANNLLVRGDALNALTSLAQLPEFASEYLGKVKLAYLDPPFNTQQSFLQYDDALEHSVWLTMMRDRLLQIKDLLSDAGSVWVHLDDAEVHRARQMMDEVFGPENFIATVIWEKTTSGRNDAQFFSTDQDYILVYARDRAQLRLNRLAPSDTASRAYKNPDDDPRGPWREIDYKGPKSADERPNLYYPIRNPFTGLDVWPRRERVWAFGPELHQQHVTDDLLWWGKTGQYRFPKLKKFLGNGIDPMVPRTLWSEAEADTSRRAKDEIKRLFPEETPFATPKPEKLLQRIIEIGSDPDDIVLDCFLGSGTTAAVAQKTGRRWVGVERDAAIFQRYALPRLEKVVAGEDPGGITSIETLTGEELPEGVRPGDSRAAARVLNAWSKAGLLPDLGALDGLGEATARELIKFLRAADKTQTEKVWSGDGGFQVLEVSPSMFEVDNGLVFLADWMTNGSLAEATAAQLGFSYETDPPFAGRKGRARLAVIDGVVNESVVRLIVSALPARERVVICGTGIDTEARQVLRDLRPGSTLRKIPAALLSEYRSARQLRLAHPELPASTEENAVASVSEAGA